MLCCAVLPSVVLQHPPAARDPSLRLQHNPAGPLFFLFTPGPPPHPIVASAPAVSVAPSREATLFFPSPTLSSHAEAGKRLDDATPGLFLFVFLRALRPGSCAPLFSPPPLRSSAASLDVPRPGLLNSSRRLALASRVPTTMPVSIEELDSTVRTFYEGRGDQVRSPLVRSPNFEANVVLMPVSTAKSRPGRPEPGKRFPRPHTTPAARRRHSKRRRRSNQSSQHLSLSAVC